jgi:hypothetical protein
MRPFRPLSWLAAIALCAAAVPASAFNCYMVLDRTDNVIYQDIVPPVDLSDRGNVQREQMRARGEQMIALDTERCPQVVFFTGAAGTKSLAVDQVVAGMQTRDLGVRYGLPDANTLPSAAAGKGGAAARPAAAPRPAAGKKY